MMAKAARDFKHNPRLHHARISGSKLPLMSDRASMDARSRVMQEVGNIPKLTFPNPPILLLKYTEPKLQRPERILPGKKNDKELHATLKKLFSYLERGVSKLEFGRTSDEDWTKYFRFATDRLRREADKYVVVPQQPDPDDERHFVNETRDGAQQWFRTDLVPRLKRATSPLFFCVTCSTRWLM
jgi:hypothetical protein